MASAKPPADAQTANDTAESSAAEQTTPPNAELDAVYRFSAVPRDYVKYAPVPLFTTRKSLLPLLEQGRVPLCNAVRQALASAAKIHPRDAVVDDVRDVSLPLVLPINYHLPSDEYFFGARVAHAHVSEYIKSDEVKAILAQSSFSLVEAEVGQHGLSPSVRLLLKHVNGDGRKSHWVKALFFAIRYIRNACLHRRQSTFITTNYCHHPLLWRYKLDERGYDWVSVAITANVPTGTTAARQSSSSSPGPRFTVRFFWFDTDDEDEDGDGDGGGHEDGTGCCTRNGTRDLHTIPLVAWPLEAKSESRPPGPNETQATEGDIVYAMEQTAPLGGRD